MLHILDDGTRVKSEVDAGRGTVGQSTTTNTNMTTDTTTDTTTENSGVQRGLWMMGEH